MPNPTASIRMKFCGNCWNTCRRRQRRRYSNLGTPISRLASGKIRQSGDWRSRDEGVNSSMLQRFLDPAVLAGISGLDLVAKTVVDGFVAGLHRSPDFGFSQEFAEYRAYNPGDDLRHVDWNVYARTERAYLKRYRGETN